MDKSESEVDHETIDSMQARHDAELKQLAVDNKLKLKALSKSQRAVVEAQAIQLEFDLRARQREEIEYLEAKLCISHFPFSIIIRILI